MQTLYLIPFIISTLVSVGVSAYCWRHRTESGAAMYVLAALSPAVWTFGYVLELVTPTLQGKVFWDNVQFIGRGGWFMGFIAFTLQYVDRRPPRQYLTYGLVAHPSIGLVLLAFTDSVHGWLRPEALLVPGQPSFGEQQ